MNIESWRLALENRLSEARNRREQLNHEIGTKQEELKKLDEYERTLRRFLELDDEFSSGIIDVSRANSITDTLVLLGYQKPDRTITVRESINRLIEKGIYPDEKGAADSVYGIFAHREDLFKRTDKIATYQLTDKAVKLANTLMQPRLPEITKTLEQDNGKGRHNPIATFLLATLGERPHTLQELVKKALERGFTFPGKKPGRVIHWALVAMAQHELVERNDGKWRLVK